MKRERPKEEPKRDYCNFLASYLDSVYELQTIEEQANALFGVLEYMIYDLEPHGLSGGAAILFKMAKPVIDRSIAKQATSRINGSKHTGTKPRTNPGTTQTEPNHNPGQTQDEPRTNPGLNGLGGEIGTRTRNGTRGEDNTRFAHSAPALHWFEYKAEQGRPLTERQAQIVDNQITRAIEKHGREAVNNLVNACIASGYAEIYFDRLEKKPKQQLCGFDALIAMEEAAEDQQEVYSDPQNEALTDNAL